MASFGPYLRELREARGISLDQVSEATRVARSYLESLEREELAKLPAPVFVRGFIRAYCNTLGVSPDEAIGRYEQSAPATADRGPSGPSPRRAARQTRGQVMVSLVLLVVLGAALLAITTTLRSGREGTVGDLAPAPDPGAHASSPSEMASGASELTGALAGPPASAEPGPTAAATAASPAEGTPARGPALFAPAETPPGGVAAPAGRGDGPKGRPTSPGGGPDAPIAAAVTARDSEAVGIAVTPPYHLTARTSEATWIRVRTEDGQHMSEELIPAGQVREWVSNRRFALRIGNAGGVRLELNGRAVPPLGRRGEIVERLVPPAGERP